MGEPRELPEQGDEWSTTPLLHKPRCTAAAGWVAAQAALLSPWSRSNDGIADIKIRDILKEKRR